MQGLCGRYPVYRFLSFQAMQQQICDLARQDTEMWVTSEVSSHLQGPSDLLCTPLVTGVAVVMSQRQRHCWRLAVPKLDIFLCFLVFNTWSS
jgi:hypothetical protein